MAYTEKAKQLTGFIKKAGDVMTGFLTLHADPTANMHAATKQYVDNKTGMDLLWTNASHKSQQPAQAITINHEGYKFFIAAAKSYFQNDNPDMFAVFVYGNYWGGYFMGHDAGVIITRRLYFRPNDLYFTDGSKGANTDNSRCVITHIWGVK